VVTEQSTRRYSPSKQYGYGTSPQDTKSYKGPSQKYPEPQRFVADSNPMPERPTYASADRYYLNPK
jgi:hypothetical protein